MKLLPGLVSVSVCAIVANSQVAIPNSELQLPEVSILPGNHQESQQPSIHVAGESVSTADETTGDEIVVYDPTASGSGRRLKEQDHGKEEHHGKGDQHGKGDHHGKGKGDHGKKKPVKKESDQKFLDAAKVTEEQEGFGEKLMDAWHSFTDAITGSHTDAKPEEKKKEEKKKH